MQEGLPPVRRYATWLAVVRIYAGAFWLIHGILKIAGGSFAGPGGAMTRMVGGFAAHTTGPYHAFLTGVVLTHATLFGGLVEWGETLAGVSLLLGLFTRLGGVVGIFLALNYWLAKGAYAAPGDYTAYEIVAAVLSAINVVLPTGRFLGLDAALGTRRRR